MIQSQKSTYVHLSNFRFKKKARILFAVIYLLVKMISTDSEKVTIFQKNKVKKFNSVVLITSIIII